jgi:hypothetical protein
MRRLTARESRCCGGGSRHLRVLRGGSCFNNSRNVRCAYRNRNNPDNRNNNVGFRVVVSTLLPRPEFPGGVQPFQAEARMAEPAPGRAWCKPGRANNNRPAPWA